MYLDILLCLNEREIHRPPNLRIVLDDEGKCQAASECKKIFPLSQQREDILAQDKKNTVPRPLRIWPPNYFLVKCHLNAFETWCT